MSTTVRPEVVEASELSQAAHFTDLMEIGDALEQGLVSLERANYRDTGLIAANSGRVVLNYGYTSNVRSIDGALKPYPKPLRTRAHFAGLEDYMGEAGAADLYNMLDEGVEQKRLEIDDLITGTEGLHLAIYSANTALIDKTNREGYIEASHDLHMPSDIEPSSFDGRRAAKLTRCTGYDWDATHFTFEIEGSSGDRYLVTPTKGFDDIRVMYPEDKTYVQRRILRRAPRKARG